MFRAAVDLLTRRNRRAPAPLTVAAEPAPRTILAVDDDDLIREALVAILSQRGWQVFVAQDAAEALWVLERQHVDLVLADVDMPGLNGFELTARIEARWPNLPVLLMSGAVLDRRAEEPQDFAARTFLQKPFSCAELLDRLEGTFRSRGLAGSAARRAG
ncbi:MAG: response regulator [Planctomycetota bacterium]